MALPAGAYFTCDGQTVAQTACMIVHAARGTEKQITEVTSGVANFTRRVGRDFIRLVAVLGGTKDRTREGVLSRVKHCTAPSQETREGLFIKYLTSFYFHKKFDEIGGAIQIFNEKCYRPKLVWRLKENLESFVLSGCRS